MVFVICIMPVLVQTYKRQSTMSGTEYGDVPQRHTETPKLQGVVPS